MLEIIFRNDYGPEPPGPRSCCSTRLLRAVEGPGTYIHTGSNLAATQLNLSDETSESF